MNRRWLAVVALAVLLFGIGAALGSVLALAASLVVAMLAALTLES